ncbi:MAG: hypothetical protein ACXVQ3_02930 [Gaiellaceae bacterium]
MRKDIESERQQLATAVEELRTSLGRAADIKGRVKAKLPIIAGMAASVGFVRFLARRGRDRG